MTTALDLTGSQQEIDEIYAFARDHSGVEAVSEPTNLDASRALNVGLPHVSPTEVLTFLTLVFTTSKAALEFLTALREQMKRKGGAIAVSNSMTGNPLGKVEGGTSDADLSHLAA